MPNRINKRDKRGHRCLRRYAAAVKPTTRLLYAESPANPTMRLTDLEALGALCLRLNSAGSRCERAFFCVS